MQKLNPWFLRFFKLAKKLNSCFWSSKWKNKIPSSGTNTKIPHRILNILRMVLFSDSLELLAEAAKKDASRKSIVTKDPMLNKRLTDAMYESSRCLSLMEFTNNASVEMSTKFQRLLNFWVHDRSKNHALANFQPVFPIVFSLNFGNNDRKHVDSQTKKTKIFVLYNLSESFKIS